VSVEPISDRPAERVRPTAEAVRREQVWAAVVHAVDFLLEETESRFEDEYYRAMNGDDQERVARLSRKLQMVQSLRGQVEASPDGTG
jgi:hypothetical protein